MAKSENQLFGKNAWEVIGDQAIRAKLKRLGAKLRREILLPSMERAMKPMLWRAIDEITVATGELRKALTEITKGQTKGRILVDVLVKKVEHAGFAEFGTRHGDGNHDMLRVWDGESDKAYHVVTREIAARVTKEAD